MDHEDPRSEAAAKSTRSARRTLKRLRSVFERERRERRARDREQEALDPVQAFLRAMAGVETVADRTRLMMRMARRRRLFDQAEQALVDGVRPLLIVGAPTSLAGIDERLRLMELADDADALVVYLDD